MNELKNKEYKARNALTNRAVKIIMSTAILFTGGMITTEIEVLPSLFSVEKAFASNLPMKQIQIGGSHTLGLTADGDVYGWGKNPLGQLGTGATFLPEPTKILGLTKIISISAGSNHSGFLTSEGRVLSIGYNYYGTLGNGTVKNSSVPIEANGLSDVVSLKVGSNHSLALKSDKTVWAWGDNRLGELGIGSLVQKSIPTMVKNLTDVAKIEAGNRHNMALKEDGTLWAWGANNFGQIGNNRYGHDGVTTPAKVPITDVLDFSLGTNHSTVLKADGTVWAWGSNHKGELGQGESSSVLFSMAPLKVVGLTDIIQVKTGLEHTIALKSDGTVWSWGLNNKGQVGNGTSINQKSPKQIAGLTNVVSIEASVNGNNSRAITEDGNVYIWGENFLGELNNANNSNILTPVLQGNINGGLEDEVKEKIAEATIIVVKAETTKMQVDVDVALALVNALPDSADKTSLTERLSAVQKEIDASKSSYEEMMSELIDMKAYLLTGEGTQADVLAMKDALNGILGASKSLLTESQRTEVAHYVQDVLDIIGLLEIIWDKLASGQLAGIDTLVTQLPTSNLKTKTLQDVEVAKTVELEETLNKATASVEKAEQSKLQADVDASRSLVDALEDSIEKASLIERLEAVQKGIDDEKLLADQVIKATAAVKKAETSKVQTDIDAARKLVEALPSISEKPALTIRLDSILVSPEGEELVKEAQDAVDKLNDQSTKEQLTTAKELVAKLPTSSTKTDLSDRITKIELNQKAINAVVQAEKMQTNYNITLAEKAINQLPDGPLKTELAERIQQLKLTLEAESKVKSAELTKRDPYITDAMESINKLNDSPKKTELTNRMKVIQDALAGEAEATLLEEATIHVVLAEQHKRDPYLTSAKDLVSKLKEGADKTALEARLKAIQDAAPVTPEAPEVDPALLKAAETQVSYAERYKRDPYLTRAQEAVDKLPTSEVKTVMQERLNVLTNEASDQVEAAKLKTASDRVAKAETASDLFVIEEARSLVNGLKDGDAKQTLSERIEAIEVTELMQFAYELKVEIDAITDVTIKQALQEAYTAVGVAKERQTLTYMTKASKSIEALNKYEATYSNVIEKLSTFFTDMQKELEMQKLIVAADNAVALAEKYKRAPYFVKAQAAIDLVPVGKAKTDLQTRLDVVMN